MTFNGMIATLLLLLAVGKSYQAVPASARSRIPKSVNWYGDERGSGNSDAFYDLIYDESICEGEFKSVAIANFVYLGPLLSSFVSNGTEECLSECFTHQSCASINFYGPKTFTDNGFCELLSTTHKDHPNWMKPFKGAYYYEDIFCQNPAYSNEATTDEGEEFMQTITTTIPRKTKLPDVQKPPTIARSSTTAKEKNFMKNFMKNLSEYVRRKSK